MSIYRTSDFPTATTLILRKHKLLRIDRTNPRRAEFEFKETKPLEEDLTALLRGELMVNPSEFWAAQKRCKQLLYNG